MFTSLRPFAILSGLAVGGLVTTIAALALWGVFTLLGVTDAPSAALVSGLGLGLCAAGYTSGRMAPAFARFHGMVTGLVVAGFVVVISRLGGSPAPTFQVLLLAVIGIAIGGVGGIMGGSRNRRPAGRT